MLSLQHSRGPHPRATRLPQLVRQVRVTWGSNIIFCFIIIIFLKKFLSLLSKVAFANLTRAGIYPFFPPGTCFHRFLNPTPVTQPPASTANPKPDEPTPRSLHPRVEAAKNLNGCGSHSGDAAWGDAIKALGLRF